MMWCFRISETILSEIEGMMEDFFWSNKENRRIHWTASGKTGMHKEDKGFYFCGLRVFNLAMLAKLVLRIMTKSDCLLS